MSTWFVKVYVSVTELFLRKWERKLFWKYKHTIFTYIFIWVRKLDSNSLTKTKNWSGRNEVTETSGRLHTLCPQKKWLPTPRTADYRNTRQDRWIQTELAFKLAKNATKPNSFEIIPLQTTIGRQNGSKGPILNVYDDDMYQLMRKSQNNALRNHVSVTVCSRMRRVWLVFGKHMFRILGGEKNQTHRNNAAKTQ